MDSQNLWIGNWAHLCFASQQMMLISICSVRVYVIHSMNFIQWNQTVRFKQLWDDTNFDIHSTTKKMFVYCGESIYLLVNLTWREKSIGILEFAYVMRCICVSCILASAQYYALSAAFICMFNLFATESDFLIHKITRLFYMLLQSTAFFAPKLKSSKIYCYIQNPYRHELHVVFWSDAYTEIERASQGTFSPFNF